MLNLRGFKGFATTYQDNSKEANTLLLYSAIHDTPLIRFQSNIKCPDGLLIPCGSVEWCLKSLGVVVPNYYPDWLSDHLYRKVWKEDSWPLYKVFIKPADRYKRFTGFVTTGTYRKKRKPPFWCSEIIGFKNEWRYYIANGKILCGEWYAGDGINTPQAPCLNLNIPADYCGAVDFGQLETGEIALIEAQHPFACGWYGSSDTNELYIQWLIDGWDFMLRNKYH